MRASSFELLFNEAAELLEFAFRLNIKLYGGANLHRRAMNIARRFSLPATYDAHYAALAEKLNAPLWTADKRLAYALDGFIEIQVISSA